MNPEKKMVTKPSGDQNITFLFIVVVECVYRSPFRLEYRNPHLDDRINGFCARFGGVGGEIFFKGQKPSLYVAANMVAFS